MYLLEMPEWPCPHHLHSIGGPGECHCYYGLELLLSPLGSEAEFKTIIQCLCNTFITEIILINDRNPSPWANIFLK